MSCDYTFKFITLGDSAVGKTCLTYQFTHRSFPTDGPEFTMGTDFGCRTITINGQKVRLRIWDTAGQERFRSIIRSYFKEASGALLVYDITRRDTFVHVDSWLEELRRYTHPDTKIMLLGNKSDVDDRERQVSAEEGSQLARDHGLMFMECSATTGVNVEAAFVQTAKAVLESVRPIESNAEELKHRGIQVSHSHGGGSNNNYHSLITPINGGSSCCYSS